MQVMVYVHADRRRITRTDKVYVFGYRWTRTQRCPFRVDGLYFLTLSRAEHDDIVIRK